jgi:hypothetical protein
MSYVPFEQRSAQQKKTHSKAKAERWEQAIEKDKKLETYVQEGMRTIIAASQVGRLALTHVEILRPVGLFRSLLGMIKPQDGIINSSNYSSRLAHLGQSYGLHLGDYTIIGVTQGVQFNYEKEIYAYNKDDGTSTSVLTYSAIADIEGRIWGGLIVPDMVPSPNTVGVIEGRHGDIRRCDSNRLEGLAEAIANKISQIPS